MALRIYGPDGPHSSILDDQTGYQLITSDPDAKPDHLNGLYFKIPARGDTWVAPADGSVWVKPDERPMSTGRDLKHYAQAVNEIVYRPGQQCMEIGPAVGELMQYWIGLFHARLIPKPIAIESVDYANLGRILDHAAGLMEHRGLLERIRILRERCRVMMDPANVRLYNMPLSEAAELPELQHCADVLVDHHASLSWISMENGLIPGKGTDNHALEYRQRIAKLHGQMLSPGATYIVFPPRDDVQLCTPA